MMFRWIGVDERLPEPGEVVVVVGHHRRFSRFTMPPFFSKRMKRCDRTDEHGFVRNGVYEDCVITHWYPVPKYDNIKQARK